MSPCPTCVPGSPRCWPPPLPTSPPRCAASTTSSAATTGPSSSLLPSALPSAARDQDADEVGHLLHRVAEELVGWIDAADELAKELEADHAKELRPGGQPAEDHGSGHLGRDGVGDDGGLLAE